MRIEGESGTLPVACSILVAMVVAGSLAACEPVRGPKDEQAAWNVAIHMALARPNWRGKQIVLRDETSVGLRRTDADDIVDLFRSRKVPLPKVLADRFVVANRASAALNSAMFKSPWGVKTLSTADVDQYFGSKSADRPLGGVAHQLQIQRLDSDQDTRHSRDVWHAN